MFKRVALFIATNLAIVLVLSIVLRLLGIDSILDEQQVGINYEALLVFSVILGFGGSFISLALSKWMAKRSTGAQVITQPRNSAESWLLATVERQARQAGIDTPEVAVYDSPEMNAFATGGAPQLGARRGQHRLAAQHAEGRSRGRARARGFACRKRRHGDPDARAGRREHLRHLPRPHYRRRRRPCRVPHRIGNRPGLLHHGDRGAACCLASSRASS